jgi:hypothetical protein
MARRQGITIFIHNGAPPPALVGCHENSMAGSRGYARFAWREDRASPFSIMARRRRRCLAA